MLLPFEEAVGQVFLYCLAFAAARFGIEVHAYAFAIERVELRERALRMQRRKQGKGFLGRRRIKAQTIADTPWTQVSGASARRGITPRVACKDKWRRIERLRQLVSFREAYGVALAAWRAGQKLVQFPTGTYRMRLLHGVSCAPP